MKFSIVGYGNLGKSLEKEINKDEKAELAAVYSRRTLDNDKYRPIDDVDKYDDADVLLIALGSYADVTKYAEKFVRFNTVDSFDTHAKIAKYKQALKEIKKEKISVISTGWDPGLLSLARGIFTDETATTVTAWGSGISQGHSNALRSIDGVLDAVQFTEPKDDCAQLIANGETDGKKLHKRVCYVAAVECDKQRIEQEIRNMKDYFDGYETIVNFVTTMEVRELKKRASHKGRVITRGINFQAETNVEMNSNADFTAKIMLRYAKAIPALERDGFRGPLDVFDIPIKYIADKRLI